MVSLVLWCLMLIVSLTYVGLILRADNQGEGGILSLAALIRRKLSPGSKQAAVTVLAVLFAVQRWGTGAIGKAFGPIMVCWFVVLIVLGLPQIIANPSILRAVSPTYALDFGLDRPGVAFIAMGAVVLAVTGAEALYADMGHFGRRPIALAWFCLILPALLINYFGQGR